MARPKRIVIAFKADGKPVLIPCKKGEEKATVNKMKTEVSEYVEVGLATYARRAFLHTEESKKQAEESEKKRAKDNETFEKAEQARKDFRSVLRAATGEASRFLSKNKDFDISSFLKSKDKDGNINEVTIFAINDLIEAAAKKEKKKKK